MLCNGIDREDIADFIQEDAAELVSISRDRLVRMLGDVNDALPLLRKVQNHVPAFVDDVVKEVEQKLDELTELQDLYRIQKTRITTAVDFEKTLPLLNPSLRGEIALAEGILKTRHDIKMDLGDGGGRNLGTVGIKAQLESHVAPHYSPGVRVALLDSEKRSKVTALAERLISLSNQRKKDISESANVIDVTPS